MSTTDQVILFSETISSRVKYAGRLVLANLGGLQVSFTDSPTDFEAFQGIRINYSPQQFGFPCVKISPAGLLHRRGIDNVTITAIDVNGTKAIFPVYGKTNSLPFDVFSAAFFMVSRYEEYQSFIQDEHGRYSGVSSIAHKHGFLEEPVVNIWAHMLFDRIRTTFPEASFSYPQFRFTPTFDIDAAWSMKNKGFLRSIVGFLRDVVSLDLHRVAERARVLWLKERDPFDTYDTIKEIHEKYGAEPIFFILFASYGQFDKNIPVIFSSFHELIKSLGDYSVIGIHPSYASYSNPSLLKKEKEHLEDIIHRPVTRSRQHFLKLRFPDTYRTLIDNDVEHDYTMGYASMPGYRAGICSPFKWYDLEAEMTTNLTIHPFAVMDGTLKDYLQLRTAEAQTVFLHYLKKTKKYGGEFVSLWHNESLSDRDRWQGWVSVYKKVVEEAFRTSEEQYP